MKKIQFTLGVLLFGLGALIACWLVYWTWLVWRVGGAGAPSGDKFTVFIFQFGVEAALCAAMFGGALALFALANGPRPNLRIEATQFGDPRPPAQRTKLDWRHVERILIVAQPPSEALLPLMDSHPAVAGQILDGVFLQKTEQEILNDALQGIQNGPAVPFELIRFAIQEGRQLYARAPQ